MVDPKDIIVSDGDYKIIFSNVFNLYNDKLIITNIFGLDFEFRFMRVITTEGYQIKYSADPATKKVIIELYNFTNNPLGVGTTSPVKVFHLTDGRELFFSILARSLNDQTTLLQVSVNIYIK